MMLFGKALNFEQYAVSPLTEYELGNVIWKEAKRKRINFRDAARVFSEALSELAKVNITSISDVLVLALERNLTFYDASYVFLAEKEGLTLVTEDAELLKKCKCAIRTKDVEEA